MAMDRAERAVLRAALAHWRPRMTIEMNVGRLCALLDECDRLEAAAAALDARHAPPSVELLMCARCGQSVPVDAVCPTCKPDRTGA